MMGANELSDHTQEFKLQAQKALEDEKLLDELADSLAGASRRSRQQAASILAQVSKIKPEALLPYIGSLIDALNRPEAQTRWECLEALVPLVDVDSRACERALDGAESGLFDEESGLLHLAAVKFLCKLGATTEKRSEKIWPLIDEGIQCYHGDPQFQEMLVAIIAFSEGKLAKPVKAELAERMRFDSTNGKGALQHRAQQIVDNVSK